MLRAAGIAALFLLAACGQSTAKAVVPPPTISHGSWVLDLTLSGAIDGHMSAIVANTPTSQSECTGAKSATGKAWSDVFYATLDSKTEVFEVTFLVDGYRGPGTYKNSDARVQVNSPTDTKKVWQNEPADSVTLTINQNLESGTVDATLTDASTGKPTLRLKGTWGCRG